MKAGEGLSGMDGAGEDRGIAAGWAGGPGNQLSRPLDRPRDRPMPSGDKARLLLAMSADELALARHNETLQYVLIAASLAITTLCFGFGRALHATRPVELLARLAIGVLLFALMALSGRYGALSRLSHHSGMQYRAAATQLLTEGLPDGNRAPFDRDFRSAEYIGLSPFAYPMLILVSRPLFLLLVISLTFVSGLGALVLTASPGLLRW